MRHRRTFNPDKWDKYLEYRLFSCEKIKKIICKVLKTGEMSEAKESLGQSQFSVTIDVGCLINLCDIFAGKEPYSQQAIAQRHHAIAIDISPTGSRRGTIMIFVDIGNPITIGILAGIIEGGVQAIEPLPVIRHPIPIGIDRKVRDTLFAAFHRDYTWSLTTRTFPGPAGKERRRVSLGKHQHRGITDIVCRAAVAAGSFIRAMG
jgi:hypothetical protein